MARFCHLGGRPGKSHTWIKPPQANQLKSRTLVQVSEKKGLYLLGIASLCSSGLQWWSCLAGLAGQRHPSSEIG